MTIRHICPLCEATCGLQLTVDGDQVIGVRGDADDVFSRGFVCPKGVAIGDLHHDPARLRTPMVRDGDALRPASWDEAFDRIRTGLRQVIGESGPNAVAAYLGNPILARPEEQDRAIEAFKQALVHDPIAPNVAYNIGLIYRDQKNIDEATYWFRKAIQANPRDNDARAWLDKMESAAEEQE